MKRQNGFMRNWLNSRKGLDGLEEGWIVKKNTRLSINEFDKADRSLKMVEKELDEIKFVISKDERDEIIGKNVNQLEDVGRDLTAAREKLIELDNGKLVEKVDKTKIEDYGMTEEDEDKLRKDLKSVENEVKEIWAMMKDLCERLEKEEYEDRKKEVDVEKLEKKEDSQVITDELCWNGSEDKDFEGEDEK